MEKHIYNKCVGMKEFDKMKKILNRCAKSAYWGLFLSMLTYRFLNTTLFFEDIDVFYAGGGTVVRICTWLFLKPQTIIAAIVILLCLTEEQFNWKHTGVIAVYCMLILYCCKKTGCDSILSYLMLLPGAAKVDFEKLSFDSEHINDERQHEVTFDEAKGFIRRASFSETVWKGQFERYYSEDGAAYVRTSDAFIRTAFKREEYSDNILKALEIVRHGR